jgi:hypothetical protein
MSKKRKRQSRLENAPAFRSGPVAGIPTRPSIVEFNPDYSYVKKDLRRIGILAGTFILLLIILSFFLR